MEESLRLNWKKIVEESIKRRKEQKITQDKLALLSGVSKPTLNNFEQGNTNIKVETALKILKQLRLD